MNILDKFRRSRQRLSLTPAERALLKFVQGLAISAIAAALVAVGQLPFNKGRVSWDEVGMVALTAAGVAVMNTMVKYLNARGDPPLPAPPSPVPVAAPTTDKTQEG